MQVGVSTASLFTKYMLEDTPEQIAQMGAGVMEVFLNTFQEYEPEFISMLDGRIRKNGLKVYSVHPMSTQFEPQLFSIHPRQREDANRIFERVLQAAKQLGARYYVMHGPSNMNGTVKNMNLTRIGPILKDLCEMADQYGIGLTWENVSWCLFCYPEFAQHVFDAANTEKLYFTLDIKQAARSGYAPEAYIDAIASCGKDRLKNLHICDYYHDGTRVRPALPGKGSCEFSSLYGALRNIGYQGPAFLEVYSDLYQNRQQLQQSFEYVQQALGRRD